MKSQLKEKEEKVTINEKEEKKKIEEEDMKKRAEKLKRIEDLIRANREQRKKEEDENRKKREEQSKREREERLKKMKEKQKKSEEEKRNREEEEKKRKEEEEKNKIEEKNKKFQEYQRKQKEIEQEKIKEKLIKEKEKESLLLERKNHLKELLIRQKLLRNPIISENNNNLRKKLSLDYNIPEDKIIITCPQKGSYKVQVIFISEDFDLNPEQFKNSCTNDEEFKELCYLKEIQKKVIMEGVKLAPNMLDYRGNQTPDGYGRGQKRGTYDYIPPLGWKGFGLKVLGKYDNGNDDWIKMDNNPNEWAIAYHGIGRGRNDVEDITRKIATAEYQKLIKGKNQGLKDFNDDNHPGKKIGEGVYCSNDIGYIEKNNLCGNSNTQINGKKYKMAFMLRVKPDRIRVNKNYPNEWILDGTTDEMRPYRILLKEV